MYDVIIVPLNRHCRNVSPTHVHVYVMANVPTGSSLTMSQRFKRNTLVYLLHNVHSDDGEIGAATRRTYSFVSLLFGLCEAMPCLCAMTSKHFGIYSFCVSCKLNAFFCILMPTPPSDAGCISLRSLAAEISSLTPDRPSVRKPVLFETMCNLSRFF